MALELLDSDGLVLASVDDFGLGGTESLLDIDLETGTYFLQVTGENNADANLLDTQFYGLSTSFVATSVPEPSTAGLLFAMCGLASLGRRRNA